MALLICGGAGQNARGACLGAARLFTCWVIQSGLQDGGAGLMLPAARAAGAQQPSFCQCSCACRPGEN